MKRSLAATPVLAPAILALMAAGGAWLPSLASAAEGPVVETAAGRLQGVIEPSTRSFLGVPFAAPPVGALRWRPPAPMPAWQGVRLATAAGPACKQSPLPLAPPVASAEDCLYLNVHAPLGEAPQGGPRPVMVWLHGGAFTAGAGSDYDGRELARRTGTVVVTLNYRLGLFGFMGLPAVLDQGHGGNFGLLDQWAGLRWVQDNIRAFGGDPGRVTVFGQSAGAISICAHLAAPAAKGLFQRAILQSGACGAGITAQAAARQSAEKIAVKLGCPPEAGQVDCLRGKQADEVLAATPVLDPAQVETATAVAPFVDGHTIAGDLMAQFRQGAFNRVPLLIGTTRDEGRVAPGTAFDLRRGAPLTEAEYQAMLNQLIGSPQIAGWLLSVYSSSRYGSPNLAMGALVTDAMFTCPALAMARKLAAHVPTYYYEFQDRSVDPPAPDPFMDWGAYHASEVGSLFHSAAQYASAAPERRAMADRMMAHWGQFAWTGSPGRAEASSQPWPRFKAPLFAVQPLKPEAVKPDWTASVYREHRCLLWDVAASLGQGLLPAQ